MNIVGLSISQWLPCPLGIWLGMQILLNISQFNTHNKQEVQLWSEPRSPIVQYLAASRMFCQAPIIHVSHRPTVPWFSRRAACLY